MGKIGLKQLHQRCSIEVHSRRRRLADSDGVCAKAVIDGIPAAGVLVADDLRYVEKVSFTQEKCKKGEAEETVIELWI